MAMHPKPPFELNVTVQRGKSLQRTLEVGTLYKRVTFTQLVEHSEHDGSRKCSKAWTRQDGYKGSIVKTRPLEPHLWRSQREGARVYAPLAEYLGELVQASNAFSFDVFDVGVVKHQLRLVVSQPRHTVDDRLAEVDVDNLSGWRHFPDDAEREPADRRVFESMVGGKDEVGLVDSCYRIHFEERGTNDYSIQRGNVLLLLVVVGGGGASPQELYCDT